MLLGRLFETLIDRINDVRTSASGKEIYMYKQLYQSTTVQGTISLNLSSERNFRDWLSLPSSTDILSLVNFYESQENKETLYGQLFRNLLDQLIEYNHPYIAPYAIQDDERTRFFGRLRDLFIQLCSYNVLFLDAANAREETWVFLPQIRFDQGSIRITNEEEFYLDIQSEPEKIVIRDEYETLIAIPRVETDFILQFKREFPVNVLPFEPEMTVKYKNHLDVSPSITNEKMLFKMEHVFPVTPTITSSSPQ